MDFNKIAIESIPSEYIRNTLNSIQHEFSVNEQISLIYNSSVYNLEYKLDVLKALERSRKISKSTKKELQTMITNIENFYTLADLPLNMFAISIDHEFFNTKSCTCVADIHNIGTVADHLLESIKQVNLVSDYNGEILYHVHLNLNSEVCKIKPGINTNYTKTKLENSFVNIPTFISIGDTVRRTGDDKEYIVVADPEVPNDLTSICTFESCVVAVVPKNKIKGKKYKKHINKIIKHRISNLTKKNKKVDKLNKYTQYIHLTETELAENDCLTDI